MDVTPKKSLSILILTVKIRVFGRSSVDILGLIGNALEIDWSVFSSSDAFTYTQCYKRLLGFKKIKANLWAVQEEVKED